MKILSKCKNYSHLLDLTAQFLRFVYQRIMKGETLTYTKDFVTFEERTRAKYMLIRHSLRKRN